jgi:hypothetical protein
MRVKSVPVHQCHRHHPLPADPVAAVVVAAVVGNFAVRQNSAFEGRAATKASGHRPQSRQIQSHVWCLRNGKYKFLFFNIFSLKIF